MRIHRDEVAHLGTFVEFEAVIDAANDEAISLLRLDELGRRLGLDPAGDLAGSYVDLLGNVKGRSPTPSARPTTG